MPEAFKKPQEAHLNMREIEEKIRAKAQELYEKRGRQDGHDIEDWVQAEKIIHEQYGIKDISRKK